MVTISKMDGLDLELRLQAGKPLYANNVIIKPLKINDVIDIGYKNYQSLLSLFLAKPQDLNKISKANNNFQAIIESESQDLITLLVRSLLFFLGESKFKYKDDVGLIFGDSEKIEECKVVNSENFNEIAEVIKYQNCVKNPEEKDKYNPSNSKASKIIDKLKKSKKIVDEVKSKQNKHKDNIDFASIVSSVTAKSHTISKFNYVNLTIYQLYDEYKRLQKITGYNVSVLAMVNGAKIELDDWSAKI